MVNGKKEEKITLTQYNVELCDINDFETDYQKDYFLYWKTKQ
jgi:hypothetical protein